MRPHWGHDLSKEWQFWCAKLAMTSGSQEEMAREMKSRNLGILNEELDEIWKNESQGMRGLVAYDLAEGRNIEVLREYGFSEQAIRIQRMVAHSSCPEIEKTS